MNTKQISLLVPFVLMAGSCTDEYGKLTPFGFGVICATVAGVIIVGYLGYVIFSSQAAHKRGIEKALAERKDFTESKVIQQKGNFYVATDEGRRKVFYALTDQIALQFNYADVVSAEVKVDGTTTVWKKTLAGSFAGAVAGGALIGGRYGSILGAVAAGNSIQNRINHIVVHVLLRNQPVQSISFTLYAGGDLGDSEISYMVRKEEATKLAQEVYDLFRLIIDTADQDRKQQEAVEQVSAPEKSTVQELKDLVELHEKGAISDEEFAKLKEKLIR